MAFPMLRINPEARIDDPGEKKPDVVLDRIDNWGAWGMLPTPEIKNKIESQKAALKNKVQKINSIMKEAHGHQGDDSVGGFARYVVDWKLNDEEYQLVIDDLEAQLKKLEENFNAELSGLDDIPNDIEYDRNANKLIAKAMQSLNANLNSFITDHLPRAISAADDTDADRTEFTSTMYPEKKSE